MRTAPRFKFTLLHGIILVAGLALCFNMRWMRYKYWWNMSGAIQEWQSQHSALLLVTRARKILLDSPPYAAVGTLAIALMYFCPPRPSLRRLTGQPGFVACFAASVVILVSISLDAIELVARGNIPSLYARIGPSPHIQLERTLELSQQFPGYAVAAVWGLLWLGRRWRSNPGRLEAVGRALGYYWLGFIVLGRFMSYFY
jgi:hypothetical protein